MHDGEGRRAVVVTNAQRDVSRRHPVVGAGELEQIRTRRPRAVDGNAHGGAPLALDHVRPGCHCRRRLPGPARQQVRLPHQPATEPAVVTHAVQLDAIGQWGRVDEQGHDVTPQRAHPVAVAVDPTRGAHDPVDRPRQPVLFDHPVGGRDDDSARQRHHVHGVGMRRRRGARKARAPRTGSTTRPAANRSAERGPNCSPNSHAAPLSAARPRPAPVARRNVRRVTAVSRCVSEPSTSPERSGGDVSEGPMGPD